MRHLVFFALLLATGAACGDESGTGGGADGGGGIGGSTNSGEQTSSSSAGTGGMTNGPCASPDVYCDQEAGLMWQVATEGQAGSKPQATATCSSLGLAGFSDWRLPDISELRSLIRGCPANELGGACDVTTSCVEYACLASCGSCPFGEGPGHAGCYWPAELGDISYCGSFWSSDDVPDPIGGQPATWAVDFLFGSIHDEFQGLSGTRCVRQL